VRPDYHRLMAADGLLFAYTDPGRVPLDEFNDWYDNEHGPARLTVPGISAGYRYRATDGQAPPWLALYFMTAGAIDSPEYRALGPSASAREKSVLSRLATLDRRVYEQVSQDGVAPGHPAPAVMVLSISVPSTLEDDMAAWYAQEHIPMLLAVPGWQRVRRFRLTSGTAPAWLSLHELADPSALSTPEYKAAASTPWRNRIVDCAISREKRVFAFHKSFAAA
jgi:hypothetical protein